MSDLTGPTDRKDRSLLRTGCFALGALLVLTALAGLGASGFAAWQLRQEAKELTGLELSPRTAPGSAADARPPELLVLESSTALVVVEPVAGRAALRVECALDPALDRLVRLDAEPGEPPALRLRLEPTGSASLALLRMKLGGEPPTLRLFVPRDLPLAIRGSLHASFAAIELGGTLASAVDLEVNGGAVSLSFLEPTGRPMDSVRVVGNKGSVEITGLGQASPLRTELSQRLGQLDLDLRGPWSRDAELLVGARLAGGGLWLPGEGVVVEGLPNRPVPAALEGDERPRLRIDLRESGGRLVVLGGSSR